VESLGIEVEKIVGKIPLFVDKLWETVGKLFSPDSVW
jgi:hypothetical protein